MGWVGGKWHDSVLECGGGDAALGGCLTPGAKAVSRWFPVNSTPRAARAVVALTSPHVTDSQAQVSGNSFAIRSQVISGASNPSTQ
jgi:hypothetical protein